MKFAKYAFGLGSALAAAAFLIPSLEARAVGGMSGDLGAGGVAKGDISMQAGETDLIDVTLVGGSQVDVTFTAAFDANLVLTDGDGAAVDLGFTGGRTLRKKGWAPPETGTFRFAISSADGSQGPYTLIVRPKWTKAMPVSGTGQQTFEFAMPANGSVSAVIARARGAAGQPRIVSLVGPGDTNLAGPVEPVKNVVKLAPTTTNSNGTYALTVSSTDGTSSWQGVVKRALPRVKPAHLKLSNGLDALSYDDDGIGDIFRRRCADCHSWANGFVGVRSYANVALGQIRSGSMPPDGRLPADQVKLIQAWIQTGRQK